MDFFDPLQMLTTILILLTQKKTAMENVMWCNSFFTYIT